MPLKKLANLSLDVGTDDGASSKTPSPNTSHGKTPSSLSSSSPSIMPPAVSREGSFEITGTSTFTAADLKIRGSSGMEGLDSGIKLEELERKAELGKGASGKTLLMEHKKTKDRYALKELNTSADPGVRRQALNELRIAKKHAAASDHLVTLLDAFYDEDKICILMEFCDGGNLSDLLKFKQQGVKGFPLGPITLQLLDGLNYMHKQMKQVHRDLKPANVLLTSNGVVKLADFGVSKQLDSTAAMANTQVGTTSYMAPERLRGDEYNFASDVWSVGIIVLEVLLGEHPFPPTVHKNFMALFTAITKGQAPPPPEGTAPELAQFVSACLLADAQKRPSVDQLLESPWALSIKGRDGLRQPVLSWLMKAAAKAMAMKAIATSASAPPPAPQ